MAKERKKKIGRDGDIALDGDEKFSVSIGTVTGMRDEAPGEKIPAPSGAGAPDAAAYLAGVAQVTLHREASGRGGRIVTIATFKPAPDRVTADAVAKEMRKGLGCGSHVESADRGPRVVLQGDIRDRAGQWLSKNRVKKIVRGN
jgi:translation initiation factor 1 (eIF-1/SUI1)